MKSEYRNFPFEDILVECIFEHCILYSDNFRT